MKINESYDGKTWLRSWWLIVKSNFAIIKETVEAIISDVADINNQIEAQDRQLASLEAGSLSFEEQISNINTQIDDLNEVCEYKQPKDYIINCSATVNEDNTITVTNASGGHSDIVGTLMDNQNVVLRVNLAGSVRLVNLNIEGEDLGFAFVHNNTEYTIICSQYDGWSGYVTELATAEDDALNTSDKTIVGAINELDTDIFENGMKINRINDEISTNNSAITDIYSKITNLNTQIGDSKLNTSNQTIVGAINELAYYAHITPLKVTVSVNDDNTLDFDTKPSFDTILTEREGYNSEVILDVTMDNNKYVAYPSLISTDGEWAFGFTFTDHNSKEYTLICDSENGWSGYITELATNDDIVALNTQIGDINTALENALNGGAL